MKTWLGWLGTSAALLGALGACDGGADDAQAGGAGGGDGGNASGGAGDDGSTGGSGGGSGGTPDGPLVPGSEGYDCSAPSGALPALRLEPIADGFSSPVLVTHAPGDDGRLFVVEQGGVISVLVEDGGSFVTLEEPFLSIADKITRGGHEQGLLGLAFHPGYAENGLFYVHYSAADTAPDATEGDTIVEEYRVSEDPDVADETSARRVLRVDQPTARNHNGGTITFGPGDLLFVALGDGGDDPGNAQDTTTLLGDILRIDPRGQQPDEYTSPPDNLRSVDVEAAPEIWSYGFRNPYRMNFDGCTGDLYVGDVGDGTWEEVDLIPYGTQHQNYGWPIMEGMTCRGGGDGCETAGYTLPIAQFDTGGSSIVGGAVYRGSAIPALRGTYVYGETGGSQRVYTLRYADGEVEGPVERTDDINPAGDGGRLTIYSIQNGGDGEIYFTATSGEVLRLVAE